MTAYKTATPRYEVQRIVERGGNASFRVTDKTSDSRIATCYIEENARFIVEVLNAEPALRAENEQRKVDEAEQFERANEWRDQAEKQRMRAEAAESALDAWQKVFGTSQLSHAQARLERAESALAAERGRVIEECAKVAELLNSNYSGFTGTVYDSNVERAIRALAAREEGKG
jgi:uncharacterized protein YbcC (UPF0753/DUF2309 family)